MKNKSKQPKTKRNWLKITLITLIVATGAIVLFIVLFLWSLSLEQKSQGEEFAKQLAESKQTCGHDPVIVVDSYSSLFGGSHTYEAYSPENPEYPRVVENLKSGSNALQSVSAQMLTCTVEEALNLNQQEDGREIHVQMNQHEPGYQEQIGEEQE